MEKHQPSKRGNSGTTGRIKASSICASFSSFIPRKDLDCGCQSEVDRCFASVHQRTNTGNLGNNPGVHSFHEGFSKAKQSNSPEGT